MDSGSSTVGFNSALGSLNVDEAELDEDPQFGLHRPKSAGYQMQVRQRPKALVGSSSSLVRMGFAGSNSSLSRPGHVGGRVGDASVSPVSPLSETTSVISDSDRPLFNLDESSSESPSSSETDKPVETGRTEDSDSDSKGTKHPERSISNGSGGSSQPQSASKERDSVGNYSLPTSSQLISQNSSPVLMPKSQSELNIKKMYVKSVSVENNGKLDPERLENKKKRNQFLKLLTFKKKKS